MATFSIAQISDLHLCIEPDWLTPYEEGSIQGKVAAAYDTLLGKRSGRGRLLPLAYPSSYSPDIAACLLKHLISQMSGLDALIVSGDLATTGRNEDLKIARAFFDGDMPNEWNPFSSLEFDSPPTLMNNSTHCVVSVPGNHDRYDNILAKPGNRGFERHFGDHWDFGRGHASQLAGSSNRVRRVIRSKEDSALILCLGDCSLNSPEEVDGFSGRWGQGVVTSQIIKDFELVTRKSREEVSSNGLIPYIVWVIHFPPEFPNLANDLKLIDGNSLVLAAERCGVDMILSGHTHKALGYKVHGQIRSIPVYCCGSATGLSPGKVYEYSRLKVRVSKAETSVSATNFVWSDASDKLTFEPHSFPMYPPTMKRSKVSQHS